MGEPWSGRQGSRQQRPGRPWHAHAHDVAAEAGLCRVITGKTRAVQGSNRVKILWVFRTFGESHLKALTFQSDAQ
jgi:hypothetical protein